MKSREGVDLSNNNGNAPVDFPALGFCIAKVSEGLGFTDGTYAKWAALAAQHGVLFGGYHFAHPDANDPLAEADYYLSRCSYVKLHALDVESRQGHDPLSIMSPAGLANWINQWCGRIKASTGTTPHVYCNRSYLAAIEHFLGDWPIWLAVLDGHAHTPQYAGRNVAIEQYAIVGGVDRNVAYVELDPGAPAPKPTPPEETKVLSLVRAPNGWIGSTDGLHKRHLVSPDAIREYLFSMRAAGLTVKAAEGDAPFNWPQDLVDSIPDA